MELKEGTVFYLNGHKFEIDMTGPQKTLLLVDGHNWEVAETHLVERALEIAK